MNLYSIYRTNTVGYDEYDGAVVAASSVKEAQLMHPGGELYQGSVDDTTWPKNKRKIKVLLLGKAIAKIEKGVILASFNAG